MRVAGKDACEIVSGKQLQIEQLKLPKGYWGLAAWVGWEKQSLLISGREQDQESQICGDKWRKKRRLNTEKASKIIL